MSLKIGNIRRVINTMTTANKITILRILLIPYFPIGLIYYECSGDNIYYVLAIASLTVMLILDLVDGFVARHFNQKSEIGAILDPFADKLLLAVGIIILSFYHGIYLDYIPLWLFGAIIGQDLLLLVGFTIIRTIVGKVSVNPHIIGKIATGSQMIVIFWILLKWDRSLTMHWFLLFAIFTAVCTMISALLYAWDGMKQFCSDYE
jgi:CDP-diacylglycerol--glycerol-3-phosphate 3-phosphatidyltransferase